VPKLRFDQYLSVVLICLGLLLSQKHSVLEALPELLVPPKLELLTVAPIPVFHAGGVLNEASSSAELLAAEQKKFTASLSAQAIYVLDVPSASVLLSKNANQVRYPASTTKLMTALVVRDIYSLTTFLTVDREASTSGTVIGLHRGEKIPVRNLISGMLIQSGNDAAEVLANNHPQGRAAFIEAMNHKARALHLDHSNFTNPSGIDTEGHQSTARDLALLAREIMKDPLLAEIVRTPTETIQGQGTSSAHLLVNTNALLTEDLGVIGVKTGTTELAGEVLITQLKKQNRELLIVVMGSSDRYSDTKRIIAWIASHYIWMDPNSDTLKR
jgi:D-alanyl-D-alanine carboxypeptidase (penicillin-binding protein 5/6)